jgi:cell division protein ZapA (FtsZ GTPase activity inhibitor)
MRLLNVALIILTALATMAGYLQEKKRLATIRALPPAKARDLYDAAQTKRERVMIVVTVMLGLGAVAAVLVRTFA